MYISKYIINKLPELLSKAMKILRRISSRRNLKLENLPFLVRFLLLSFFYLYILNVEISWGFPSFLQQWLVPIGQSLNGEHSTQPRVGSANDMAEFLGNGGVTECFCIHVIMTCCCHSVRCIRRCDAMLVLYGWRCLG